MKPFDNNHIDDIAMSLQSELFVIKALLEVSTEVLENRNEADALICAAQARVTGLLSDIEGVLKRYDGEAETRSRAAA